MNKAKLYKLTNTLAGIIIGLLACWYLYLLLKERSIEIDIVLALTNLKASPFSVILVVFLMPLNWLIETVKWSNLIKRFQKISMMRSIQSILFGISLSLLTPNRIGDLGGRLIHIQKGNRIKALYTSLICSYSQLLITILAGLAGFIFSNFEFTFPLAKPVLSVIAAILIWLFFASDYLKKFLRFVNTKFSKVNLHEVESLPRRERLKLLLLSFLRYIIFCIQFVMLLYIFEMKIDLNHAISSVSIIFLISAIIPTAWISDLPVRTSIAYFVLDYYGYNGTIGLMSSAILWIINLFVPAIVGLFFSPHFNLFSNKYSTNAD